MTLDQPMTHAGRCGLEALLRKPGRAVVAFDYDGTLAPIVDDPSQARPHPAVIPALGGLAQHVGLVAIVTGRPAAQAVELAGLRQTPRTERFAVVGHYGMERWDADSGEVHTAEPPAGLEAVRAGLPRLLDKLGASGAVIEDKGLSIAVHVRRMPDPAAAFTDLRGPLESLAEANGLTVEPGRFVLELRPPGMDKGIALRRLVQEAGAATVVFAGDDLGDLAAFAEVQRMRAEGLDALLLCSGSVEVTALAGHADVVLDGPAGVAAWIEAVVEDLADRTR